MAPIPTAEQIAAAAADMRLLSIYMEVEDLITLVSDQRRGKSPEADIADLAFERLHGLRAELDQLIDQLAPLVAAQEAEASANLESEEI